MFKCKRCNHEWHPREKNKPKVCPRCKSTQWEKDKIRSWEKIGKLYVVLLSNGIKVGQSIIPGRRMQEFTNRHKEYFSYNCKDINKAERLLIKRTIKICGKAIKGREYFEGGEKEYCEIVSYLKTVGDELLTGQETYSKNITDYDWNKIIKNSQAEGIHRAILQERKNCLLAIGEAIEDAQNNKCSYRKALMTLSGMLGNLVISQGEKLGLCQKSPDGRDRSRTSL